MVFACQKDSFLKEFATTVVSCSPSDIKIKDDNGKETTSPGYAVVLEDTILFPEGGGQPSDKGYLNNIPVVHVARNGAKAVHYVPEPLQEGDSVKQTLNWERRLDHMQHHSGQHLITAIILAEYGYKTTSWWLGEDMPHIELDTPSMTKEQIQHVEDIVNEKIREAIPVNVDVVSIDDPVLKEVRSNGLPEDHTAGIRIVSIKGIDRDLCCGTHITNTSQLQVVKLLNAEKGKKGKTNLQFLVGNRVIKRLSVMLKREEALTAILNNGADWHVDLVDKLSKSQKVLNKSLQGTLKELATQEAKLLKVNNPKPKYHCVHRKEGETEYINTFLREIGTDTSVFLFLTAGEDKGAGSLVLFGQEDKIASLGPQICDILDGKGAGKGTKFQGKVKNLSNRAKAEQLIKESFQSS